MKLPVKPKGERDIKDADGNWVAFANTDRDEIITAINSHKKLVEALKENFEYTKYAGANKRINTKEYMDEFFKRGLSAQQIAKQALKETEKL